MNLDSRRRNAGLALIGAILADHQALTRLSWDAGVRLYHFDDDTKLIYLAAWNTLRYPLSTTLSLAQRALEAAHFWDPTQIRGNLGSMQWSKATLDALAHSWVALPANVRRWSRELIELDRRLEDARDLHQRLVKLLQPDPLPAIHRLSITPRHAAPGMAVAA